MHAVFFFDTALRRPLTGHKKVLFHTSYSSEIWFSKRKKNILSVEHSYMITCEQISTTEVRFQVWLSHKAAGTRTHRSLIKVFLETGTITCQEQLWMQCLFQQCNDKAPETASLRPLNGTDQHTRGLMWHRLTFMTCCMCSLGLCSAEG